MEAKHILAKIRQQKKEKKEYLFALELDEGFVKSVIWTVDQGQVRVLSVGSGQKWQNQEELIEAVDESLSSATEKSLFEEEIAEPNKVIFGLPSEWVKGERIISEKIKLLKALSQKLELTPVGFVVTVEAIVHYLKSTEGIPPTAILLGLNKDRLVVTLTNLGKIVGSEIVKRSDNLGADLAEGLSRFEEEERFPARVLLYNAEEDLEEARQELINYPWQEEGVKFLHLPKVEILASDFDIKAVALSGGCEVARAEGISVLEPIEKEEKERVVKEAEEVKEESFGFVKGKDIAQMTAQKEPEEIEKIEKEEKPEEKALVEEEPRRPLRFTFPQVNLSWLRLPKSWFLAVKNILPVFDFQRRIPLVIGLVLGAVLVISGISIAFLWNIPQAKIVLLLKPYELEKDFSILIDPSLEIADKENLALPAETVKAVIEDEKSSGTTGTKLIGEPAKGEVTIYNRTSTEKKFSAGTKIIGPDDLKFSLDDEVTVASESSGPDYTKIPGKATGKVTALEIGTEGNLASGTEFSVANFARSDFIAKNESAFGGGTSREMQVVSENDQERLTVELKEELEGQVVGKLLVEIPEGRRLLEESLTAEIKAKAFDKEVGEETAEITLKLKMEATALSYNGEELQGLIKEEIEKLIPADFEYRREESEISFELMRMNKDGSATFTAHFKVNLVPKFDLEKIARNLAGKYPAVGETYLENLPHVEGIEIEITPRLPARLATFPRNTKRIKIEVRVR